MHLDGSRQDALDLSALQRGSAGQVQRQLSFAPRLLAAGTEFKIIQLQLPVGRHLVVPGPLPADVAVDPAGDLIAGQVDETAGVGRQLLEVAADDGRPVAQRTFGRDVQEAGPASQFVDDRPGGRAVEIGGHQNRLLPGEFLPVLDRGQIAGFQAGFQSRRIGGLVDQRQRDQSRLDLRRRPQIQGRGQHLCQFGQIDAAIDLQVHRRHLADELRPVGDGGKVVRLEDALCSQLGKVRIQRQTLDIPAVAGGLQLGAAAQGVGPQDIRAEPIRSPQGQGAGFQAIHLQPLPVAAFLPLPQRVAAGSALGLHVAEKSLGQGGHRRQGHGFAAQRHLSVAIIRRIGLARLPGQIDRELPRRFALRHDGGGSANFDRQRRGVVHLQGEVQLLQPKLAAAGRVVDLDRAALDLDRQRTHRSTLRRPGQQLGHRILPVAAVGPQSQLQRGLGHAKHAGAGGVREQAEQRFLALQRRRAAERLAAEVASFDVAGQQRRQPAQGSGADGHTPLEIRQGSRYNRLPQAGVGHDDRHRPQEHHNSDQHGRNPDQPPPQTAATDERRFMMFLVFLSFRSHLRPRRQEQTYLMA